MEPESEAMMTEDQILSLAHRTCWKYRHSTDPHHSHTYKFNDMAMVDFVRKVEAAIGHHQNPSDEADCSTEAAVLGTGGMVDIFAAVFREIEEQNGCDDGNAPGHGHEIPGIWDDDNGKLAGQPCAWCALWNRAKAMIAEADGNHEAVRFAIGADKI